MDKVNKLLVTEKNPSERKKLEYESRLLDIKQHSLKIFLNSIYGAFGNKYFTLGDDDLARSITLSGQAIINQGSEILTKYVENLTVKKLNERLLDILILIVCSFHSMRLYHTMVLNFRKMVW